MSRARTRTRLIWLTFCHHGRTAECADQLIPLFNCAWDVGRHQKGDVQLLRSEPPLDVWVTQVEGDLLNRLENPNDLLLLAGSPFEDVTIWYHEGWFALGPPEHLDEPALSRWGLQ